MSDHASFSSNPFPDGRLVALNTMGKAVLEPQATQFHLELASQADHSRVLRYVHKHYTQAPRLIRLEDHRGSRPG